MPLPINPATVAGAVRVARTAMTVVAGTVYAAFAANRIYQIWRAPVSRPAQSNPSNPPGNR